MIYRKEIVQIISKNKGFLLVNLFISLILALSGPFSMYAQMEFIDALENMVRAQFVIADMKKPAFLLIISFLLPVSGIMTGYLSMQYNGHAEISWSKRMSELIRKIPYYEYEHGEIYNKIKLAGENNVYAMIISCVFAVSTFIIKFILYAIILIRISIWLSILTIVLSPATAFLSSNISDRQLKNSNELNTDRRRSIYKSHLLRSREYAKEIRIHNCAEYMINDWHDTQKMIDSRVLRMKFKYGFLSALIRKTEYIMLFINLAVILYLYLQGKVTTGIFIAVSNQLFSLRLLSDIQGIVSQLARIKLTMRTCLELSALTKDDRKELTIDDPVTIELKNVSYRYPMQKNYVLKNINLQFQLKQSVAIVGENGAGKSTLMKLLTGLYEPTEGEILINGVNLRELPVSEKSRIYGVTFQDFGRFCLTLKENITFGEDGENFKQKAQYFKIDKLADQKKGYDLLLGREFKDAIDVSGGEWQSIAIMRALVGEKQVLIFDEPTASLDPLREVEVFEKIRSAAEGKISMFVTHRLGFTSRVDRIIFIKDNQIMEDGTFEELMDKDGYFKQMFNQQKNLYYRGAR